MSTSTRPVSKEEIQQLESQGCRAESWQGLQVTEAFDPTRVQNVTFSGKVQLGSNGGTVELGDHLSKPAGVYGAYIANCTIGDDVRIANIGSHIANYAIGSGCCIENAGTLETNAGATFGNGVEVESLNEGGGREVILHDHLSAQFAYLQCLVRWRPKLAEQLDGIAKKAVDAVRSDRGTIGAGVTITSVSRIVDVNVGEKAVIRGAASLTNGSILSCPEAPTLIGTGVIAKDFIVAEGATVDEGAIIGKSFVGQGSQIGKQYSAEGSLFFANCEGFHGEACSIFAGPYTVSHHKSTLMIAGLFSFYNAGSGTNQSNHMYKLGPVHEGKLERGCKTGSFSYMMWPCRVGPFSVILGKHTRTFDTRDFPFSHIAATSDGRCEMVPGLHLSTVGTVRDGAKWPTRDRRKAPQLRDIIDFDVLSPLTVGRMLRGLEKLRESNKSTDRSKAVVTIDGAEVRRVLLRKGMKFYEAGIEMYLQERLVDRIEKTRGKKGASLDASKDAMFSEEWIDVAGQMMPWGRFETLCERVESGAIGSVDELQGAFAQIHELYGEDEWAWVAWAYQKHFGTSVVEMDADEQKNGAESWRKSRTKFLNLIAGDAGKEFNEITSTGFGVRLVDAERDEDFVAVRGTQDDNKFVKQIQEQIAEVARRVDSI